jgi:hypothetical protein
MQANGAGNWPNAPGAPTIGTATDTTNGGSVSVTFTAPTFAGIPATITGYTVTSSPGGVTGTGASSPITVSGLTNGTAYTFTVTATNASGTGPASAASNSVTPSLVVYIEQTFSTYLYTSTGGDITITNNIDLSTKGGLVWIKSRSNAFSHYLTDTVRGAGRVLYSDLVNGQSGVGGGGASSFSTTGYVDGNQNAAGVTQVSWTFREQPKFFDIVTLSSSTTTYNHNLGSVPGCIIVKCTNAGGAYWVVWHRSFANTTNNYLSLNTTDAVDNFTNAWPSAPTSTQFSINPSLWANGTTGIAYLFAHDAGGFGLTGTDNVISCGTYTGTGAAGNNVTLGYEPQWLLIKQTNTTGSWVLIDTMRGFPVGGSDQWLYANLTNAESTVTAWGPTATGFISAGSTLNTSGGTYIYIAIRRGPMKVPTVGTSVFNPAFFGTSGVLGYLGSVADMNIQTSRTSSFSTNPVTRSRLVGGGTRLTTSNTNAEVTDSQNFWDNMIGVNPAGETQTLNTTVIDWTFKRAPSVFDVVCYTGTGANRTVAHNLTVAPELMIIKKRSAADQWAVYSATLGAVKRLFLNSNSPQDTEPTCFNSTSPTASVFTVGTDSMVNGSGSTYVAYLFSSLAGVSKVGSYTGTGSTQTINCGFTSGARFVLIKRTNDTGDWYVWDTTRGMVSGTDPYLRVNETYSENNTNSVYTTSVGFQLVTSEVEMNANGSTYIFLAIA